MGQINVGKIMYMKLLVQCLAQNNSSINGSSYVVQPYHFTCAETEAQVIAGIYGQEPRQEL